jgi:mRNA interferase MazF
MTMTPEGIPDRGDLCWLDLNPQSGAEQAKRRPCLIISPPAFNRIGLCIVCPITSRARDWPSHVPLPKSLQTSGFVMTEQVKSLDYRTRNVKFIEKVPVVVVVRVRQIVQSFI